MCIRTRQIEVLSPKVALAVAWGTGRASDPAGKTREEGRRGEESLRGGKPKRRRAG